MHVRGTHLGMQCAQTGRQAVGAGVSQAETHNLQVASMGVPASAGC